MLRLHRFTSALTVEVASCFDVPHGIRERVQALWEGALAGRPELFDGPILTVTAIGRDRIEVAAASYRFLLAAGRDPELKAALHIRPLAVSGLLRCPEGYVFGRRGSDVTEAAGVWELVPSGGAQLIGGSVDVKAQVLSELREEIGLEPQADRVETADPVGGIEDLSSGVVDVVIPMTTTRSAADICRAHEARASREYTALHVAWAASWNGALLPASQEILTHFAPGKSLG